MKLKLIISILLLAFGISEQGLAQQREFSTSLSIGLTTPILDNGTGLFLGVNSATKVTDRFSLEGQASVMRTSTSSFLTGKFGNVFSINALFGGRLYLNSAEKSKRIYLNTLIGFNYFQESYLSEVRSSGAGLGWSAGAYYEIKKLVIGLSVESPQNYIARIGYQF